MNNKGRLIVVSAPSGAGKSSIINEVMRIRPAYVYSVSSTTRAPREHEVDGVHYYFLSKEEFQKRARNDEFAEWAELHANYYGTEHRAIRKLLDEGKTVLLDVDVIGGQNLLKLYANSLLIFIKPPSFEELRRRLLGRAADKMEDIEIRLRRYQMEMQEGARYPHQVVNDDLSRAVKEVLHIIDNY